MLNYLQLKLQKQGSPQSENQIRSNLVKMQMSLTLQNETEYYMRSKIHERARQIIKALSISEMPDLIIRAAINQHL
jgi:hypothetical protein